MRVNEGKLPRILSVKSVGEFRLRLRFANDRSFAVDLSRDVKRFKPYRPLRDQALFARAALGDGGHSVIWPVGELDMGADTLWQYALEQNGRADAAEFIRWRWRNRLSLTAAAEGLGLSRRQVAYYASGQHEVPRTVLLACKGWESEKEHAAA
jgi:hypothetical protein